MQTEKVQIQKELFQKVISDLEIRSQKAQNALDKLHADPFKL